MIPDGGGDSNESRLIQETVGYEGACEMLDCGKNTILNLCKAGELASTIHAGRRRIYIDSIEAYAERIRAKAYAASNMKNAAVRTAIPISGKEMYSTT